MFLYTVPAAYTQLVELEVEGDEDQWEAAFSVYESEEFLGWLNSRFSADMPLKTLRLKGSVYPVWSGGTFGDENRPRDWKAWVAIKHLVEVIDERQLRSS